MNIISAFLCYIAAVNVASIILYRKYDGEFSSIAFYNGIVGLILIPMIFFVFIGAIENTIGSTGDPSYGLGFLFLYMLNIIVASYFVIKKLLKPK